MKHQFQPGDILACSGTCWVSWVIRLGTCSPYSHVALVVEHKGQLMVVESTTLSKFPCEITGQHVRGVQAHALENWLPRYQGRVWRVPLADDWQLRPSESAALTAEALRWLGRGYDAVGALGSAPRCLDALTMRYLSGCEGRQRAFCSRVVVHLLKSRGVRRWDGASNSNQWNPAEVVRFARYTEKYLQPVEVK